MIMIKYTLYQNNNIGTYIKGGLNFKMQMSNRTMKFNIKAEQEPILQF